MLRQFARFAVISDTSGCIGYGHWTLAFRGRRCPLAHCCPYTVSRAVLRIIVYSVYGVQRSTISGFAARSWTHVLDKIGKCSPGPDLTWIPAIANLYATSAISRIVGIINVQATRKHAPEYLILRPQFAINGGALKVLL